MYALAHSMMEDDGVKEGLDFHHVLHCPSSPYFPFHLLHALSSPWIIEGGEWERVGEGNGCSGAD